MSMRATVAVSRASNSALSASFAAFAAARFSFVALSRGIIPK